MAGGNLRRSDEFFPQKSGDDRFRHHAAADERQFRV